MWQLAEYNLALATECRFVSEHIGRLGVQALYKCPVDTLIAQHEVVTGVENSRMWRDTNGLGMMSSLVSLRRMVRCGRS